MHICIQMYICIYVCIRKYVIYMNIRIYIFIYTHLFSLPSIDDVRLGEGRPEEVHRVDQPSTRVALHTLPHAAVVYLLNLKKRRGNESTSSCKAAAASLSPTYSG